MTLSLTNVAAVSVRWLFVTGLIVTLAAVISAGHRFEQLGGRLLTVQTGSMQPVFQPGDVIIAWRVAPASLQVGDIVSYHSLRDPGVTVSHRIVSISSGGRLTTRGDALPVNEPSIPARAIIGRVGAVAPGLGRWLAWLRTPVGLGLTVYLPALRTASLQLRKLTELWRSTGYRLYDR